MRRTNKPIVRHEILLDAVAAVPAAEATQIGSEAWFTWLAVHDGFVYEGRTGHFTGRRELRRGISYWYGYRRVDGKLSKIYLGKAEELTSQRLEQASAQLAGQLPLQQLIGNSDSPNGLKAVDPPRLSTMVPLNTVTEEVPPVPLSKIKPPALAQKTLSRPRLIQKISTPVTLITAGSGFGTTTLLNDWRQNCGQPVAWVTLDRDDNYPVRFWLAVVTALQTICPGLGCAWLAQLVSASAPFLSRVVINLTDDIIRAAEAPNGPQWLGLVLDDYHHIQNSEIHTSLQALLGNLPPTLRLVVSSHHRLPFALGYLRAKGMVTELGTEDLRFTAAEGVEFLVQHTPERHLAYGDMQALVSRTEGWITGLVLAGVALTQREDHSRFPETFTGTHPLLREFYSQRVLRLQPPEVRTFLMKTAILERLTGPLCDAVTSQSGGAKTLAKLRAEELFLHQLDDPDWYRYHGLFAEMLRAQLQEHLPTEIRSLHRKAAGWYRTQNARVQAVFHLLAAEDWEEAAALIESVALQELEELGEDSRLLRWLQQLPEAAITQHKTLLGAYIRLATIALSPAEAEALLARLEEAILSAPASGKGCPVEETLAELHGICRLGVSDGPDAAEDLGGENNADWQVLNGIIQFRRDYRRDLIRAEAKAKAVYSAAQASHHLYGILVAGGTWANLAMAQGHLRQSEDIAQQVLRQALAQRGKLPEPASIALTALGNVYFLRNQTAQAHQLLVRAAEVDPNPTGSNEPVARAILRAKLQSAQGDNAAAFDTIQAIREVHAQHPSSLWLDQDLVAYQEMFRLRQGDLSSAERLLNEGGEIEMNAFSALVRAEILIEQKRSVAAEEILTHLLGKYPHGFGALPILRARVILAIALFDQRKVKQARQVMKQAARLAAPEYFIRPFLDYGPKIVSLLSLVLHSENLNAGIRSFLKGVLTMLGKANGVQRILPSDEPAELAVATSISPRELEVLRLVCAGLSNHEIAKRSSISASTVKTHLEHIFRKLGVNSRTRAVARAQELGLV
jgi:LuxR family maltose regulon positive regulatory protein